MLGRAPRTKETLPDFFLNMDLDKWDITVWYRVTRSPLKFFRVDGLSMGPPDLGCHNKLVHSLYN